jgi:hypothetical protein
MKTRLLILLPVILFFQPVFARKKVDKDSVVHIMDKVASWQIRTWQEHGKKLN